MPLTPRTRTGSSSRRPLPVLLLALVVPLLLAACGGGAGAPVVSFDPAGPCTGDGQQPGAYPDLEASLPTTWEDRRPDNVDSGRTCTPESLGTLATHGVEELRFAGATWKAGGSSGVTVAVFEADRLDPAKMIEFYEAGARVARRTDKYVVSETTVAGQPATRLDVLGSDGTAQTVVAWPAGESGRVNVLLAADLGDTKVAELLEMFGSR
jgi:hypothetical protein